MTINASEKRLDEIFNIPNFQFEIPSYQRPYAWTKDQIVELIDDLIDAFPYFDNNHADYFLGSIILIEKAKKPQVEVVDGQQRLTTLTLLFSIFRHLLFPENNAHDYINSFMEKQGFAGTLYGLKVRTQDDPFFGEYIRTSGGIEKLLNKDVGLNTDSQKLLRDNANRLITELKNRCPENITLESWIIHLLENILNKCYLVTVSTDDFDTAYRIFSTINSRGLDLQLNDILKSDIIGKIQDDTEKEKYTEIWEAEESDLGRKDFEALFTHIHRIKTKEKAKKGLLTEYRNRKELKPQNNPTQFIDKVLKPYSDNFEIIRDCRFNCDSDTDKQEINRLFGWLNRIDNSDWLPPAIYFLATYGDKSEEIKAFFTQLERLAAGFMILRLDINQRIKRYAEVLKAIEISADDAITKTKELLSPEEQNRIIEILDGDLYLQTRSRLYVLLRLDSAITEGGLSPSFTSKLVTIEHVLPQNPNENSYWCKKEKKENWSESDREKWVHRLGNLVLLSRKKNAQAQNFDFVEKKTKYFNPKGVTPFPITINVINQDEWNQQIVELNQQQYLDKLVNIWNLKQESKPENNKSKDFYINIHETKTRTWEDWQKYGFVSGGGGRWYSQTLKNLSVGDRVFVNYCRHGYVGVGIVEETVVPVKEFKVMVDGKKIPILEAPLKAETMNANVDDLDLCEYLVRVMWIKTFPREQAYWEQGFFAIQHTCCRLRHSKTIEKLYKHFGLDSEFSTTQVIESLLTETYGEAITLLNYYQQDSIIEGQFLENRREWLFDFKLDVERRDLAYKPNDFIRNLSQKVLSDVYPQLTTEEKQLIFNLIKISVHYRGQVSLLLEDEFEKKGDDYGFYPDSECYPIILYRNPIFGMTGGFYTFNNSTERSSLSEQIILDDNDQTATVFEDTSKAINYMIQRMNYYRAEA